MRRRRGFSLLEVLLSFFVISIVLIILINLYPMSHVTLRRGEYILAADGIAQDFLERVRGARFDSYAVDTTATPDPVIRKSMEFKPTIAINRVTGAGGPIDPDICKEIVVKVQWIDRLRGQQTVTHRIVLTHVPD